MCSFACNYMNGYSNIVGNHCSAMCRNVSCMLCGLLALTAMEEGRDEIMASYTPQPRFLSSMYPCVPKMNPTTPVAPS